MIERSLSALAANLLASATADGINVFGAGGFARDVATAALSHGVKVHALLVSKEGKEREWNGIPILRAEATDGNRPTWVAVFNREPHSDYSALRTTLTHLNPMSRLVWPQEYYELLEDDLGWRFWLHARDDYLAAAVRIANAREMLEGTESQAAFDAILRFRRATDANWESPKPSADLQYLPMWLREILVEPIRIVDAGAYRGETLRELASVVKVDEAWTFEPDPQNYAALVAGLSDAPFRISHFPAAVSDKAGTALFNANGGEGGSVSPNGTAQVPEVALDTCLHNVDVNFLKLDVEGHELEALSGALATIRRHRPVLAVAGYHRWDDLWRIPEFISGLDLGYRLRLGLHGHNSFDSVLYAY